MRLGIRLVCLLLLALSGSCGGGSAGRPTASSLPPVGPAIPPIRIIEGQAIRVLFVGNSLTQANDLPLMVTALAAGVGAKVESVDVSQGGFSLEDHWKDTRALRAIEQGGWHFVVMQQGPSALAASRENLRLWARRFAERIRAVGGRPAMYMIWPEAARMEQFENVRQSYLLAGQDINGLFLPAGDAWRAAWRRKPGIKLYGGDNFHPSVLGSYTAALVIASKITSRPATEMPSEFLLASGTKIVISSTDARVVQAAAVEVVKSE